MCSIVTGIEKLESITYAYSIKLPTDFNENVFKSLYGYTKTHYELNKTYIAEYQCASDIKTPKGNNKRISAGYFHMFRTLDDAKEALKYIREKFKQYHIQDADDAVILEAKLKQGQKVIYGIIPEEVDNAGMKTISSRKVKYVKVIRVI